MIIEPYMYSIFQLECFDSGFEEFDFTTKNVID